MYIKHKYLRNQHYQKKLRAKAKNVRYLCYVYLNHEKEFLSYHLFKDEDWLQHPASSLKIYKYISSSDYTKHTHKYYKVYSNKIVRRTKGNYSNSKYKRIFDYAWTID